MGQASHTGVEKGPQGLPGQNVDDDVDSILVGVIAGLVRDSRVEPPQLALLHAMLVGFVRHRLFEVGPGSQAPYPGNGINNPTR